MKQIGHIDGANAMPSTWKTHSLGMLSPHDLFIPNPGERENVSADQWHHVGWVDPDKNGGVVWDHHAEAGDNSRPAYIQRVEPVPVFQDKPSQTDPMDIRRSEFDALCAAVQTLELKFQTLARIQQHGPLAPSEPPMTFYDHAFIAAYIAANETMNRDMATKDAHDTAAHLTRNRANQP